MGHAFLNAGNDVSVTQQCTKRAYLNNKEARRALNRGVARKRHGLVAMGTGIMNVYRCGICGAFQLGHK